MAKRMRSFLLPIFAAIAALLAIAGVLLLSPVPSSADAVVLTELPDSLSGLFTDYTRTELSEEYRSEAAIDALKKSVTNVDPAVFDRAEEVLHGNVKFDPMREFSTEADAQNRIAQFGNVANYSDDTLKWHFAASDLLITGIYGIPNETFTVYVESEDAAHLPHLVITAHHGYYTNYRSSVTLYRGANTFTFSKAEAGPVYIVNPYTPEEQKAEVSLYIEGGDFYPVFEKGGDGTAFLGTLKAYEEARKADSSIPDLAELSTDFAFFTTTSSSLYDTYLVYHTIDPQKNLELWGDFFTALYEFNGIPTSRDSLFGEYYDPRIEGVRLNFRYMRAVPNSGAYAFTYHIGFYNEQYWFANFCNDKVSVGTHETSKYSMYAMGHEIGHMLDTDGRRLDETTNNMCATFSYLKLLGMPTSSQYQPYGSSLEKLTRDATNTYEAYRDIHILYTSGPTYDRNYMVWWYLEECFPDYWAKLNDMYRRETRGRGLGAEERMVYYSSLVTGVDLENYFERWGMYLNGSRFIAKNASQTYRTLMDEAREKKEIEKKFDRFYYADDAEYNFIRQNDSHPYEGAQPTVSVKSTDGKHTVSVSGKQDPAHLGYEVLVSTDGNSYAVAGFTRSVQFTDEAKYQKEPTYKVIAVNRFFETSEESLPAAAGEAQTADGVCRVGNVHYDTLLEGINNVEQGGTVYLLADCSIGGKACYRDFTLKVDDSATESIRISNSGSSFFFQICANVTLSGKPSAHIIIDGGTVSKIYPPIYAGSGTFTAEYTDFEGCVSTMGGGAILSQNKTVLRHCSFSNCSGGLAGFVSVTNSLTLEDCTFAGEGADIQLAKNASLTFIGELPSLRLTLAGDTSVTAENEPSEEELSRITADGKQAYYEDGQILFGETARTLTFRIDGKETPYTAHGTFVFGEESLAPGDRYIKEYRDIETDDVYHTGDALAPSRDMIFECVTEQNAVLILRFKSGKKEYSLRADGTLYLPRTDGTDKIVRWIARDGEIYPAGGSAPASAKELIPIYEGCFRYDFFNGENYIDGDYVLYGTEVELPELKREDFRGWLAGGALCRGKATIAADTLFTAVFGEEEKHYDLSRATVVFSKTEFVYDGSPIRPEFTVMLDGELVPAELYTVSYASNLNAGRGSVTVVGKGLAEGSVAGYFTISPRPLTAEDVTASGLRDVVYTGEEIKLAPTLTAEGEALGVESYTLAYSSDLINVGVVTVTVVFQGNYAGEITLSYHILKAKSPVPPQSVAAGDAKTLSEISLPANWEWADGDLPVSGDGVMTAQAVYTGADAGNYESVTAEVEIVLPEKPVDPEEPEEPEKPVDPENPEKPDPEEPEESDKPVFENPATENPKPEQTSAESKSQSEGSGCNGSFHGTPLWALLLCPLLLIKRRKKQ